MKVKKKRKKIPPAIETDVLENSGRRCCLCYILNNDYDVKVGQIAHLDKNRSNNSLSNLAFLCLVHHNSFDSRTSQSKNFSITEVKRYRKKLQDTVSQLRKRHIQDLKKSTVIKTAKSEPHIYNTKEIAPPPLNNIEFIAYYSDESLASGEKTNINFKFKNNTKKLIHCFSYQFEGYNEGELIAKYNRHSFNLLIQPEEEKVFPFNPVNPITDYFKNQKQLGDFESKVYIEYRIDDLDQTKLIVGIARINIV
jgi:hypothetical protein